jgi:hypothetical protein
MKKILLFSFLLAYQIAQSQSALITPNSGSNGNFLFKSTGSNYGQFSTTATGASLTFRVNEPAANNGSTGLITGAIYSDATRTVLAGFTDSGQLYGINKVEIGTNAVSNRMVMNSIGNVGIGTITPDARLEVSKTGLSELRISSVRDPVSLGFLTQRVSFISDKGSTDEWRPAYIQTQDDGSFTGRLDFYTNGVGSANKFGSLRSMSITNGNVGVGTTTPLTKMDVNGPILTRNRVVFGNQAGGDPATTPVWVLDNYGSDFRVFQQSNLTAVGAVHLTVNSSGNVGIGTTNPTYKLDMIGDLRMQGADFVMGPVAGRGAGGRALVLDNNNMLSINFANDFAGGTFINSNVGIGTIPNPTYKLSINGTARSKEVIVETGWADYVFEEDYKLSSLSEVESFIKENKHLPDVPSAKDIQEKGAFVGELMTKMMQKIEELTLYSIEQDKKIGQLQKDLVELLNKK